MRAQIDITTDPKATLGKTVLWLEDHSGVAGLLAIALRERLGVKQVIHSDRVDQAMQLCAEHRPELVLLDWRLEEGFGAGLRLPRDLSAELPETRWLLFTGHADAFVIRDAIDAGVHGCICKRADPEVFFRGCQTVLSGQPFFCERSNDAMVKVMRSYDLEKKLNETERRILYFVAQGMETKDISLSVHVGEGTVRNYLVRIREKLRLSSMVDLAHYAIEHGIAPPRI